MLVTYKLLQVNVVASFKTESEIVMVEIIKVARTRVNGYQLDQLPFKAVVSNAPTLRVARG